MRNVYEVLSEKESAIERVRREIEALHLVSHLLADDDDARSNAPVPGVGSEGNIVRVGQRGSLLGRKAPDRVDPVSVARLRTQLVGAAKPATKGKGRSVLLQFRDAAVGASRTFLRRVLDSRLLEPEVRQELIRELLQRFARSPAA